jgi:GTPase KRas protein
MDTSGREMYTRMIQMYILDQDGYMFVYDITSRTSFDRVRWFHAEVKREQARLHDTTSSPMCIIGNKLDMETERQVSSQEGFALAEELGCSFFETCSKDSASVEVPFHGMVKAIRKDHATGRGAPRMLERGRIYPHGPFLPRKRRPQSHKPSLFSRLARVFRSNKHG